MNRRTLVRGIQTIVFFTLVTFAYLTWKQVSSQSQSITSVFGTMKVGWLLVATVLALQEGVCGGLRMFTLGRVLCPQLTVRTAVASEFVLMFVAGVTPGQLGAPVAQVATLVEGGMPLADIATAELLTAFCTILFFLLSASGLLLLRRTGLLILPGAAQLDYLIGFSFAVFGTCLVLLILCVVHPPLLKTVFRTGAKVLGPLWHGLLGLLRKIDKLSGPLSKPWAQKGYLRDKLVASVDRVHAGFKVYLSRGKLAVAIAFLLTIGFFWARFSAAFFIIKGLGLSTTPETFVTIGPPFVQVVIVQTMLNFALYLSPTPGASGIAETMSTRLMAPWVRGAYEIPYLVLWRLLALFLCMFVGGTYVFRYLGTDVLERRAREAEAQEEAESRAPSTESSES